MSLESKFVCLIDKLDFYQVKKPNYRHIRIKKKKLSSKDI